MFDTVLVANRGEIALRIIRTCRDLGIRTIAVHSSEDGRAPFALLADHAVEIGPAPAAQSYLVIDRIIRVAHETGAQAIHPGYGFLSENQHLARSCAETGLVFIGPTAEAMAAMGDKISARRRMAASGVPVIQGTEALDALEDAVEAATRIGYPVLIKASAGGGGIGMRMAADEAGLRASFEPAQSTAERAFGDGRLFLERFVTDARHVEIQVLADAHGNVIHVGERECSIQRRFQKVIEESPSPALDDRTRDSMGQAAVRAARAIRYLNAGTVEFVFGGGEFFFLEMNTRLQVEHPVTELISGLDLVAEQLRIAAGEPLRIEQAEVRLRGHAIECRVYAEDPSRGFVPSPGRVTGYREPAGPGVRVDGALNGPGTVSASYDPMIAKVITWGSTREMAVARMRRSLLEYAIVGIVTNITFLLAILDDAAFAEGDYSTRFLDDRPELVEAAAAWDERRRPLLRGVADPSHIAAIAATLAVAGNA
ncbi:MAG: acetyl/propionyl/methylcrotonyl-CoA carboxylase subunit alpha [Candidatus Dormibacteria bacterium]